MDLHISLTSHEPVSGAIYRQIRDAILDGRLLSDCALPSSRELARRLQVSRTTVVLVYERLRAEGFVEARVGAGTFVSERVQPRLQAGPSRSSLHPRPIRSEIPEGLDLSATPSGLRLQARDTLPSAGGLHLAAVLADQETTHDGAVAERAHALGVAVRPLSYHYAAVGPRAGLLLGYGAIATENIEEGLHRLATRL